MTTHDVGSLHWGRRSRGQLTRAERRRIRRDMLTNLSAYTRSRLLLALGGGSRRAAAPLEVVQVPDTALARACEEAARDQQSPQMLTHALRSIAYAHAIASLDGLQPDPEMLWCACLLHDIALERPVNGDCFAVRGGEIAEQTALLAGAPAAVANELGDAISRHVTPALNPQTHPVPFLVASGALVDVLGLRLDEMSREFVTVLNEAYPRDGFAKSLAAAWRAEVRAVPTGRAAVVQHTGLFAQAARYAPLPK